MKDFKRKLRHLKSKLSRKMTKQTSILILKLQQPVQQQVSLVIQLLKKKKLMSPAVLKKAHKLLRAERSTLDSGLMIFVMDMEAKFGLMVLDTRVCGKTVKRMVKGSLFMLMEIRTQVSGQMTRQMVRELIRIPMELSTMASGKTINSTGMELNPGLTVLNLKAIIQTERRKDRADSHLLMEATTEESFKLMT